MDAKQELKKLFIFFILQMFILYYFGIIIQSLFTIKFSLIITEIFLILVPSLIFIKHTNSNINDALEIKKMDFKSIVFTILLTLGGICFAAFITFFWAKLFPPPEEFFKQIQKVIEFNSFSSFLLVFLVTALLPAICEEVMFRGMIITTLLKNYSPLLSSLICGILFGIFHFSIYRFLPTAFIGIYLSLLRISKRSIIYSMLAHLINNLFIVLASNIHLINLNKITLLHEIIITLVFIIMFISFLFFPYALFLLIKDCKNYKIN